MVIFHTYVKLPEGSHGPGLFPSGSEDSQEMVLGEAPWPFLVGWGSGLPMVTPVQKVGTANQ